MLVLHQEKSGISAALKTGINASDAKYISFFDIDDICADNYIKVLCNHAASNKEFDVLVFKRYLIYRETASIPGSGAVKARKMDKISLLKNVLFDTTRFGNIHNILVKREFINIHRLRFAEGYSYYEDYDFMYRAYAVADRILYLDKWLYGYVVKREGSVMSSYSADKLKCLKLFKKLEKPLMETVPEFAPLFKQYAIARIYWSVLWQTARVSPSYISFKIFTKRTCAKEYMRMLKGFPEKKVKKLRTLFLFSEPLYYLVAKTIGRRYTSLGKTTEAVIRQAALACPKPG